MGKSLFTTMKKYSKDGLDFHLTIKDFGTMCSVTCALGGVLLLLFIFSASGKLFTPINFLLFAMFFSFLLLVTQFVKLRSPSLEKFKIGSYAYLKGIYYCCDGPEGWKYCAILCRADDIVSSNDLVSIAVNTNFLAQLGFFVADETELRSMSFLNQTIRFVENIEDISVSDQKEGVKPIILSRCLS